MKINSNEIRWSGLSTADEVGRVFFWRDKVLRGIFEEKKGHIQELFQCGMLAELIRENLIPDTKIANYTLDHFGMVIEHEKIHTLSYPYEWSFEMLKDAALTVLRINIIAAKYGYQMKDCHAFNVVFKGTVPLYVDIGSFIAVNKSMRGWICYEEFLRSYEYLLYIGKTNDYHWVKQLLTSDAVISHESHLLYKYPLLRWFGKDAAKKIAKTYFLYKSDRTLNVDARGKISRIPARFFNFLGSRNLLPFKRVDLVKLHRRISAYNKMSYRTVWGEYHTEFHDNALKGNYRFERIIEILREYPIKTVFEVAGNQGFFSRMMLEKLSLEYVCCSDYDENAVDAMYELNKGNVKLGPVLMNFLFPNITSFTLTPKERYASDMVIALAVTHHILLSQNIGIDFLLTSLKNLTGKFIAVEFMPLGLWDGQVGKPVPHWYNVDWFRENFKNQFNLLVEEQLEENRIFFFGAKK